MPSPFAEAAAAHSAAVDEVYGEPLRFLPQGKPGRGGGVAGADPSRKVVPFTGAVTRRPIVVQRQGVGAQGATNLQLSDARWQVSFDAGLALDARAGDLVERLDPPAGQPATLRLAEALSIRGRTIHPADPV